MLHIQIPHQGENNWLAGGEGPSFVDFYAYEALDHHRVLEPKVLDGFKKLSTYMARFEALPGVAEYMKSDRFMSSPIYMPTAKWTG